MAKWTGLGDNMELFWEVLSEELPQLIWGTTSKGTSVILQAWGIRYLVTASLYELQNNTNPSSHNKYASKNLSTVSCSASSAR
jgi:hypothetical protein